jgi:transposase-like protein
MSRGKWKRSKKENAATKGKKEIKNRLPIAEIKLTECPHCKKQGQHKTGGGDYPNGNKRLVCEFCGKNFIGRKPVIIGA